MAITSRTYKIPSSTSLVYDIKGLVEGMPEGMTSSWGTDLTLTWDDSKITAVSSGTIKMYAEWKDENEQIKTTSASLAWEIIPYRTVTYELNTININGPNIIGYIFIKMVFSDDFKFTTTNTTEIQIEYTYGNMIFESNKGQVDHTGGVNVYGDEEHNICMNSNGGTMSWETSGTDFNNFGQGNLNTKTLSGNRNKTTTVTKFNPDILEVSYTGSCKLTFAIPNTSSYSLKIE